MHDWSETDFDWEGLNGAINLITKRLRWWRIGVHSKEKYGRADISVQFGWRCLHDIIWPGYCFRQWRKCPLGEMLWHFDIYVWPRLFVPLNWIVAPIHRAAYRRAYRAADKRWPHLHDEVWGNADHRNILDGRTDLW